ncbi:MAG: hypothetical protein K8963_09390, partial [Proteobacteria bacterium]|nr:hypothetical protein [Pseudomonadota bacterium]
AWIREPRIFIYGSSTGACTRLDSGHKMANDLAAPSSPVARCSIHTVRGGRKNFHHLQCMQLYNVALYKNRLRQRHSAVDGDSIFLCHLNSYERKKNQNY